MTGDCLLAAAFIAYLGPYDSVYRKATVEAWKKTLVECKVPFSEDFSFIDLLGSPVTVRQWVLLDLPKADFATENAIAKSKTLKRQ